MRSAGAALQSHAAQVAGAGITTVFDAVRIGSEADGGDITEDVRAMVAAVAAADADDRLRADHLIHLRCELPTPDAAAHFEEHCTNPIVHAADDLSVMHRLRVHDAFRTLGVDLMEYVY